MVKEQVASPWNSVFGCRVRSGWDDYVQNGQLPRNVLVSQCQNEMGNALKRVGKNFDHVRCSYRCKSNVSPFGDKYIL